MIEKGLVTKLLSFFLFLLYILSFSLTVCNAGEKPVIRSATYLADSAKSGVVHLKVEGQVLPVVSLLGGDSPRLILDFPETRYATPNRVDVSTDGPVETLRFGLHQNPLKTRVVIDLNPECKVNSPDVVVAGELLEIRVDCISLKENLPHSADVDKIVVTTTESLPKQSDVVQQIIEAPLLPHVSSLPPLDKKIKEMSGQDPALVNVSQGVIKEGSATEQAPLVLYEIVFESTPEKGEMVLFYLSDFLPPDVSAVEKDSLLVHCDFPNVEMAEKIPAEISTTGAFIKKISAKKNSNPEKIQIELELSPEHNYDLQQIFYKKDNVFALIINAKRSETAQE